VHLERGSGGARGLRLLGDAFDEVDVVRTESEARAALAGGARDGQCEGMEAVVDVATGAVGDRGRLVVGALDQPDGRSQRQQALHIGSGPPQVRLEADADAVVGRPQPLVQLQRGFHVGRAFHVDP
jgi:hypothetical protein